MRDFESSVTLPLNKVTIHTAYHDSALQDGTETASQLHMHLPRALSSKETTVSYFSAQPASHGSISRGTPGYLQYSRPVECETKAVSYADDDAFAFFALKSFTAALIASSASILQQQQ